MVEHVNPQVAAQLHRYRPVPLAPSTPTAKPNWCAATSRISDREQFNDCRALDLQTDWEGRAAAATTQLKIRS